MYKISNIANFISVFIYLFIQHDNERPPSVSPPFRVSPPSQSFPLPFSNPLTPLNFPFHCNFFLPLQFSVVPPLAFFNNPLSHFQTSISQFFYFLYSVYYIFIYLSFIYFPSFSLIISSIILFLPFKTPFPN